MASIVQKGFGSYSHVLGFGGGTEGQQLIVEIQAGRVAEVITRIATSFGDLDFADPNILGRIVVLKEDKVDKDAYVEPHEAAHPFLSDTALDHCITTKKLQDWLRPGDGIVVPAGKTYLIILCSAYQDGDAFGAPSTHITRLTVEGRTMNQNKNNLESY